MLPLVPEVHIFVCLDPRVSPGPLLHCLDLARAQDWQQETVLICDESWRSFVNVDQPVLFIDKSKIFPNSEKTSADTGVSYLDDFLENLDNFEIKKVTQVGALTWGRWLQAYFENEPGIETNIIQWDEGEVSSLELVNDVASELALDITSTVRESAKSSAVYIDPYIDNQISPQFLEMLEGLGKTPVPSWLNIVVHEEDQRYFEKYNLNDSLVEYSEVEINLFNQSVLCFSDSSPFAQTSRSYNIALFNTASSGSFFLPGDIEIQSNEAIHISELFNILSYWKMKRLKELSFQWLNMGVEVQVVECFHSRVVKRNLLNYSSDLYHCQVIVDDFVRNGGQSKNGSILEMIKKMRKEVNNDPYSLSFSLKILLMIVERMTASAQVGERLFERLGSDYHRVIVGEALIEGLIQNSQPKPEFIDIKNKLAEFHRYLIKIDHFNDQADNTPRVKETP